MADSDPDSLGLGPLPTSTWDAAQAIARSQRQQQGTGWYAPKVKVDETHFPTGFPMPQAVPVPELPQQMHAHVHGQNQSPDLCTPRNYPQCKPGSSPLTSSTM